MSPAMALSPALMAQAVGLAAGVVAVKAYLEQTDAMAPRFNACPTCNGSRHVPCMCRRWSDSDIGCGSCQGSGRMRCSSCGGSGTAKPIPVRIQAKR